MHLITKTKKLLRLFFAISSNPHQQEFVIVKTAVHVNVIFFNLIIRIFYFLLKQKN